MKLKRNTQTAALAALVTLVIVGGPLYAAGTLFVESNSVRVEADGGGSNFTLLRLNNANGAPQFKFSNLTSGTTWDMSMTSGNAFSVSTTGSGTGEFEIRKNGLFTFLRSPSGTNFTLNGTSGNAVFRGSVTAAGVLLTSSRETKEGFEAVDTTDILNRVAQLPITEWSFKTDVNGVRHIGPMAEDFAAAFKGNGKQLDVTDVQGVALAAIQGLNQKVDAREQRIEQLEQELEELRQMVTSLTSGL